MIGLGRLVVTSRWLVVLACRWLVVTSRWLVLTCRWLVVLACRWLVVRCWWFVVVTCRWLVCTRRWLVAWLTIGKTAHVFLWHRFGCLNQCRRCRCRCRRHGGRYGQQQHGALKHHRPQRAGIIRHFSYFALSAKISFLSKTFLFLSNTKPAIPLLFWLLVKNGNTRWVGRGFVGCGCMLVFVSK